jgi:pimeloyl-ACP methyl ester carboxylesterase
VVPAFSRSRVVSNVGDANVEATFGPDSNRIYARPEVVSRIPGKQSEFQPFFKMADEFKIDTLGRREQLTQSQVPILIVCGDNDPNVPATNWYPLIGRIPRGQIIVLPQSGHGPQHQYPDLSAKCIDAFLQDR